MTLLSLSVAPLLPASVCRFVCVCFFLFFFRVGGVGGGGGHFFSLCVRAAYWRSSGAENGALYNLLTLWSLFAAIVGHSEWYLRALKSNQMTFFLLFKRAWGCVVKGG